MEITAENVIHSFSAEHPAAAVIDSGQTVCLETLDCFSNRLLDGQWRPTAPEEENPATGPIAVRGALPGQMLRVDVLEIRLADVGVVESVRGSGCLGANISRSRVRVVPLENGVAKLTPEIRVVVRPMIGVLGVAPAEGSPATLVPGAHGGNMDCTCITVGSQVYLPVFVPGGLLAAGDLHAAMGDGEVGVSGLETAGRITLRVRIESGFYLPFPVVVQGNRLHVIASAPTLDEACADASKQLHRLLTSFCGMDREDAAALMTLAADLAVCQMVNPLKTVRISIDLALLPPGGLRG